jgi:hypothetical protein
MTAIETIEDIEYRIQKHRETNPFPDSEREFLLKAFRVMHEIALNPWKYPDGTWKSAEHVDINKEFEERMSKE